MSKLQTRKPTHTINSQQRAVILPPWWNKETQAAWSEKRAKVKRWQEERCKPHPDPTVKHRWRKRQTCSSEWPVKQNTGRGKASVTLSTETKFSLT